MKKILSLVLVLALAFSFGFAAMADGSAEIPTLRLFDQNPEKPDDALVSAELSKYTSEKIGVNVEIVKFPSGEFRTKMPLVLASDEQVDLLFDASWIDLYGRARSGAYLDITDMLPDYPDLYNVISPALWEGSKVDGRNYCVPTQKEIPYCGAIYAETSFLEENNIDPASIKKLEDAEVILEALSKTDRYGMMLAPNSFFQSCGLGDDFAFMYSACSCGVIGMYLNNPGQFVNIFETQEYADYVNLIRSWYEKGYIAEDVATREGYPLKDEDGNYNGKYGLSCVSYSPLNEVGTSTSAGTPLTPMIVTPIQNTTGNCAGSVWAIAAKTQYPEKCMELLQMWNTDPYFKNMYCFGIEGVHYELTDGKVDYTNFPDHGDRYSSQNWTSQNMFISYLMVGEPDDKYDHYLAFNAQGVDTPILGFNPDTTEISDKLAALNNAAAEYVTLLNIGVLDPNEYIPMLQEAVKAAGIDDCIAFYQAEYDKWVAAK